MCQIEKKLDGAPRASIEPIDYAIIDDLLTEGECAELHKGLLGSAMWRKKNPISKHLYNSKPKCVTGSSLLSKVQEVIGRKSNEKLILVDYWALLYSKNSDGNMHADFGQITLTYWLTPEIYNLNKESGGLLIYDVRRPNNLSANQYLNAGKESESYVLERASSHVVIPYRHNRAVLFDSSFFHKTHSPSFDITNPAGMRMNLTFSYASAEHVIAQAALINGESNGNV